MALDIYHKSSIPTEIPLKHLLLIYMFFKDIFSFNEEQKVSYPTRVSYLGLKTDPSITEGPVAQRIRHLTTNQGIPGSNPGGVEVLCFCPISLRNLKKRVINGGLTDNMSPRLRYLLRCRFFLARGFDGHTFTGYVERAT